MEDRLPTGLKISANSNTGFNSPSMTPQQKQLEFLRFKNSLSLKKLTNSKTHYINSLMEINYLLWAKKPEDDE